MSIFVEPSGEFNPRETGLELDRPFEMEFEFTCSKPGYWGTDSAGVGAVELGIQLLTARLDLTSIGMTGKLSLPIPNRVGEHYIGRMAPDYYAQESDRNRYVRAIPYVDKQGSMLPAVLRVENFSRCNSASGSAGQQTHFMRSDDSLITMPKLPLNMVNTNLLYIGFPEEGVTKRVLLVQDLITNTRMLHLQNLFSHPNGKSILVSIGFSHPMVSGKYHPHRGQLAAAVDTLYGAHAEAFYENLRELGVSTVDDGGLDLLTPNISI